MENSISMYEEHPLVIACSIVMFEAWGPHQMGGFDPQEVQMLLLSWFYMLAAFILVRHLIETNGDGNLGGLTTRWAQIRQKEKLIKAS